MAPDEPEAPQTGGEAERGLGIMRAGPAQRSAQIVVFAVEHLWLFDHHPHGPLGVMGDGKSKEECAMRGGQLTGLPSMVELLAAELPHRLQLPVARSGG